MARKKAGSAQLNAVAKRFGITAREARDIVTALGTIGNVKTGTSKVSPKKTKKIYSNLGEQIKEVGAAATKGQKGTTSVQFKKGINEFGLKKSKKRK